jgi:AcrR family transcriptional regulator
MKAPGPQRSAAISDVPIPIRQRQRQQTRDVILEVALSEIAEFGLSGIRIEHIARKSGVTRPTVYAHYPKREDFLRELQARTESSALVALEKRLEANSGAEFIHGLADALFDAVSSTHVTLRRESFALMLREPQTERWVDNDLFIYLSSRLGEAQRAGEIPECTTPVELTRILMTAIFGFVAIEGNEETARRADAHSMLDLLIGSKGSTQT